MSAFRSDLDTARQAIEAAIEKVEAAMLDAEARGFTPGAAQIGIEAQLRETLADVEAAFRDLGQPAAEAVQKAQELAAADGVAAAARLGRVAGVLQWEHPAVQTIEALSGFMSDGSPLAAHFAQLGPDAVVGIRAAVAAGIGAGDGATAIAERIRGNVSMSFARAENIARTETLRAYREATRLSYEANADVLDGWIRVCAGNSRTCAACWALHGTHHATSEIMPTHIMCRCVMVPDVTGYDAGIPSAESMMGQLSDADQEEALGTTRYELWKSGTALSEFGRVRDDARWGPVAELVPVSALGN